MMIVISSFMYIHIYIYNILKFINTYTLYVYIYIYTTTTTTTTTNNNNNRLRRDQPGPPLLLQDLLADVLDAVPVQHVLVLLLGGGLFCLCVVVH